jgi:hypothetical protein
MMDLRCLGSMIRHCPSPCRGRHNQPSVFGVSCQYRCRPWSQLIRPGRIRCRSAVGLFRPMASDVPCLWYLSDQQWVQPWSHERNPQRQYYPTWRGAPILFGRWELEALMSGFKYMHIERATYDILSQQTSPAVWQCSPATP